MLAFLQAGTLLEELRLDNHVLGQPIDADPVVQPPNLLEHS